MLDIGWTEMAIIAFVALIVIGPKDLPTAMRGVAKWVRKARSLSREFQSGLDEMMRETELDEAKKSIESVRRYRVDEVVEKEVDPTGTVRRDLRAIDEEAKDRRTASPAPAGGDPTDTAPAKQSPASGATGAGEGANGSQSAGKGRVVSHEARIAPGNSVKPPAPASGTTAAADAGTPAPAKSAPAKAATSKAGVTKTGASGAKSAAKTGGAKTGAAKTGAARGAAKSGAGKPAAPKSGATKTAPAGRTAKAGATSKAPAPKGSASGTGASE